MIALLGSQTFVNDSGNDRKKLTGLLEMAKFKILTSSVFMGHGHLLNADASWKGVHAL